MQTTGDVGPNGAALFVRGLAVGVVLVAVVWALVSATNDDSDATDAAPAGVRDAGPTPVPPQQPTRLQRCAIADHRLSAPLAAAGPAMDQWEVHVGAMNKLVVGAITLPQANAFWNQTRRGAYRKIGRFERAMTTLRKHGLDCPEPRMLRTGSSAVLRVCAQRVATESHTLAAADAAIDTWRMHVREMDRLRLGQLSASAATQLWLSMWHRGVRQIDEYRVSARGIDRQPTCGTTQRPPEVQDDGQGSGAGGGGSGGMGDMGGMDMSG